MHPLNKKNFGTSGMAVTFYNGSSTVTGYVLKQISQNKFNITDGTNTKDGLLLAPTTAIATAIDSGNAAYFTVPVYSHNTSASGGSFTLHYGVYSGSVAAGGVGYNVNDILTFNSTGSACLQALTVSTTGAIETLELVSSPGNVNSLPANPVATTFTTGGASFAGSITATTLTVTGSVTGTILVGQVLGGAGVTGGTTITALGTGTGGDGTYTVSASQTVGSEPLTSNGTGATFNLTWYLLSVSSSGGTGYAVNDYLVFKGITAATLPIAYISTSSSGAATATTVAAGGSGITVAATSVGVTGPAEYLHQINETKLTTTEGNSYHWALGSPVENGAFIQIYGVVD